jgi:ATP-dependent Clp protease protease subunit
MVVENSQVKETKERAFRVYCESGLCFGSQVDDTASNLIMSRLLFLEAEDPEKVFISISIPGGSVYTKAWRRHRADHVRQMSAPFCMGLAASMGAFLLSSWC